MWWRVFDSASTIITTTADVGVQRRTAGPDTCRSWHEGMMRAVTSSDADPAPP
jgi:hypothetical protein